MYYPQTGKINNYCYFNKLLFNPSVNRRYCNFYSPYKNSTFYFPYNFYSPYNIYSPYKNSQPIQTDFLKLVDICITFKTRYYYLPIQGIIFSEPLCLSLLISCFFPMFNLTIQLKIQYNYMYILKVQYILEASVSILKW